MARGIIQKYSVKMKLNNGSTSTGAVKTVNVGIGSTSNQITITNYAGSDGSSISTGRTKALAISNALSACLSKSVYALEETAITAIVE